MGQRVVIIIAGADTKSSQLGRGVRQAVPLSPVLINIYI
jgi:hypothetical protein